MKRVLARPQETLFVASAFRALLFLTLTVLTLEIQRLASAGLPGFSWVWYFAGFLALWLFWLLTVEVFPKFRLLSGQPSKLIRYLWLVGPLVILFKPLSALLFPPRERRTHDPELEEKKEEMVERALETLAETSGVDEPLIEQEEKKMISQILRLDTTAVKEIMIPRVNIVWVNHTASFDEVKEIVKTSGHSRLPVCRETIDDILGILYIKDLIHAAIIEPTPDWSQYVRKSYFVPESKKIDELLDELRSRKTHMAVVVDEYGGTAGIVTLEDILEEIVGEIHDEYDVGEPEIQKVDDQTFRVTGTVNVQHLAETVGVDLPEEKFETVGGLIYDLVGSLPEEGKVVEHAGLRFKVEKVVGQRIKKILVARTSH